MLCAVLVNLSKSRVERIYQPLLMPDTDWSITIFYFTHQMRFTYVVEEPLSCTATGYMQKFVCFVSKVAVSS